MTYDQSLLLWVTIASLLLYHPLKVAYMMADAGEMVMQARKLNPNPTGYICLPFGWAWAIRYVYLRRTVDGGPLRSPWYVWRGIGKWETWERN